MFWSRKPLIENISEFEGKGIEYIVKDPDIYKDKKIVISGGGDSALDWTIYFSKIAKEVTLVHRRSSFRGHLESVDQVNSLAKMNKINLITDSEVYEINGEKKLENVVIKDKQNQSRI